MLKPMLVYALSLWCSLGLLSAQAATNPGDNSEGIDVNLCKSYSAADINNLMNAMRERLPQEYGIIAKDSIDVWIKKIESAFLKNELLIQTKIREWKKDTTSYAVWEKKIFAEAKNKEDSISAICQWIPTHFVLSDRNPEAAGKNVAGIYNSFLNANAQGDAYNFCDFLCKVALRFPNWGTPVLLQTFPDNSIDGTGLFPAHNWVGFATIDGKIDCIADPVIGSILKDSKTGRALSLDSLLSFIRSEINYKRIQITPARISMVSTPACILSILLREKENIEFYSPDAKSGGFARASWFTYGEKGSYVHSLLSPYWMAKGYAGNSIVNVYGENATGQMYGQNDNLVNLLSTHYGFVIQSDK